MSTYGVVLFVHLAAVVAAFAASGVMMLALRRLLAAGTGAEALQWLAVGKATARTFPPALVVLVASGAYMVHDAWSWSDGWVDVGLAGAVALALLGDRVEGRAAARIAGVLAGSPQAAPGAVVRDRVFWTAALANPALALGIVFVMATKPSLGASAAALLVALAAGAIAARGLAARAEPH